MQKSDRELARYSATAALSPAFLTELLAAMQSPQSDSLKKLLALATESGGWGALRQPDNNELLKQANADAAPGWHGFYSEALERGAIATSLSGRLRGTEHAKIFFNVWQICERCVQRNGEITPGFAPEEIDRILRARALATEDIGANNLFIFPWRHLQSALIVPNDVSSEPQRAELYRTLIARLERSAAETMGKAPSDRSALFFKTDDYLILEALKRAVGADEISPAERQRQGHEDELAARRSALFESISPCWRDLFVRMIDLPEADEHEQDARFAAAAGPLLAELDDASRSTAIHELAVLRARFNNQSDRTLDEVSFRPRGAMQIQRTPFYSWKTLGRLAEVMVARPVALDDRRMAEILAALQKWRPLVHEAMLHSADATLARGGARLTAFALRSIAEKPSHAIAPGKGGPDHEGDVWWNSAPPLIKAILERHASIEGELVRPVENAIVGRMASFPAERDLHKHYF